LTVYRGRHVSDSSQALEPLDGAGQPLAVIAGLNVLENLDLALRSGAS
jgi:hypothetical protein